MKTLQWIESGGGPLVLMANSIRNEWRGTRATTEKNSKSDYQRACAVQDEIQALGLGLSQVVVLGDEPDRTSIFVKNSDVLIVRWRHAQDEKSLVSELMLAIDQLKFDMTGTFSTVTGKHILFDSAFEGAHVEKFLSIELQSTDFTLGSALFAPNTAITVLVHRLRPSI